MNPNQINDIKIAKSAAHLVAALLNPAQGMQVNRLPLEVRDSIEFLREDLSLYIEPYRAADGFVVGSVRAN